jgi:hypothetical protein
MHRSRSGRFSGWVVSWVALALGCGGTVVASDGGAAADAGVGLDAGAAGQCPARVVAGEACSATRPCLGADGCNDCYCTGGAWVCGAQVCVDGGVCPAGRPRTGDACAAARQVCAYGTGCNGAQCVCAGGRWTCNTLTCPDR